MPFEAYFVSIQQVNSVRDVGDTNPVTSRPRSSRLVIKQESSITQQWKEVLNNRIWSSTNSSLSHVGACQPFGKELTKEVAFSSVALRSTHSSLFQVTAVEMKISVQLLQLMLDKRGRQVKPGQKSHHSQWATVRQSL